MIVKLWRKGSCVCDTFACVDKIDFEDGSKWLHLMSEDGAGKIIRTKEYDRIEYMQDEAEDEAGEAE